MSGTWVTDILAENNLDDISYFPNVNGQLVFKNAFVRFSELISERLQSNNLKSSDIDSFLTNPILDFHNLISRSFS